ncbi:MAG: YceI-like domain, partial [Bacteroidota bacterium]
VKYIGANKATISGDLSLKGIKAPVTFTAYIRNADEKGFFAEAFFPLDRTLFGINYGVGAIDTEVQLAVHLYATK